MDPLHHLQLVVPQDHAEQLVRMSKYCPGLHQGDVAQLVEEEGQDTTQTNGLVCSTINTS